MPRSARKKSRSGIYHVILRGVNRQQIFYDEEDYLRFINTMMWYKRVSDFELYCYCLMGNHIHLLLKEAGEPLEMIFRRIGASFVYWYNLKYDRTGHLFQDRYKSEAVDDKSYFFTVLRYIVQNPIKAGICLSPEDYPYSSMGDYIAETNGITDTYYALGMVERDTLIRFCMRGNNDVCMEIDENNRRGLTDTRAIELVKNEFGGTQITVSSSNRKEIENSIRQMIYVGISIRQLSRLTGISKSIIETSLKKHNNS